MANAWFKNALLINEDPDWIFPFRSKYTTGSREEAAEAFRRYFGKYCGTAITDALCCIFGQTSMVPSQNITWLPGKYEWTHENGMPVNYKIPRKGAEHVELGPIWKVYHEFGLDPVTIFIETMRKGGVRPWLTLRMNDCHYNTEEPAYCHPTLFYEAKKNGWMIGSGGEDYGYFNHCLDFAHPEIRNVMLRYIREVVDRYDMDGLELDFQREIYCFDYRNHPGCHEIMNDFMREVRRITNEAGTKRGHKILLMVRLHRSIAENLTFGFDARTWAEERLVDALNPTPRWEFSDSGIPVAEWKAAVGKEIAILPGIETLQPNFTSITIENIKAYAAGWYADDADGLYAYNMMELGNERNAAVWNSSPEQCFTGVRDFLVTGQDIVTGFNPPYKPLPMNLAETGALSLTVGPIASGNELTLILDFEGETYPEVAINGIAARTMRQRPPVIVFDHNTGAKKCVTGHQALEYRFAGIETRKDISITLRGSGIVHYIDLLIQQ